MTQLYADPFGPVWKFQKFKLFTQWKGSIFQFFWLEWLLATAGIAVVLTIYYLALLGKNVDHPLRGPYGMVLATIIDYIDGRFQAAIGLMLGFYTSTLCTRWWNLRDKEGMAIGRINDIAVQIAAHIRDNNDVTSYHNSVIDSVFDIRMPRKNTKVSFYDERRVAAASMAASNMNGMRMETVDEGANEETSVETSGERGSQQEVKNIVSDDEEDVFAGKIVNPKRADAKLVRQTLVRWVNLAHAIAVGELYEKKPNEFSSLDSLRRCGLLTDEELIRLERTGTSRYVAPFVWFLDLLQTLRETNQCGVNDITILIMSPNITTIRGALADLYMYRNVPIPLSYRQLVNFTVRAYMLINGVTGWFSVINDPKPDQDVMMSSWIYFFVLSFGFEYFLFVGWLSLADALGNPFRTWADEFEWENYVRGNVLGSNTMINEWLDASSPESLVDKGNEELRRQAVKKWQQGTFGGNPRELNLKRAMAGKQSAIYHARNFFTGH